jgi:hypothetical protein
MSTITLKAHFDGERIVLDEPFSLSADAQLIVTVLEAPSDKVPEDQFAVAEAAARELSRAYAQQEPEYSASDIRERE